MADYTVAPNPVGLMVAVAARERNRMYEGTMGPATLLKGG